MKIDSNWQLRLVTALHHMADEEYQRQAWLGAGPAVSSPIEVISEVFDDQQLMDYVENYRGLQRGKLIRAARELSRCVDAIAEGQLENAALILADERWSKIREIARLLNSVIAHQGGGN